MVVLSAKEMCWSLNTSLSKKSVVFCQFFLFLVTTIIFIHHYSSFQLSSHPILSAQPLTLLSLEPTRPVFATNRVGWNFGGRSLQTHKALARVINAQQTSSRKEKTYYIAAEGGRERRSGEVSSQMVDLSFIIFLWFGNPFCHDRQWAERTCVCGTHVHVTLEVLRCPRLLYGPSASNLLRQRIERDCSRCSVSKVSTCLTGSVHCLLCGHFKAFLFGVWWTAYVASALEWYGRFKNLSWIKTKEEKILSKNEEIPYFFKNVCGLVVDTNS